ncbi:MAG: hypothetical protein QGH90_01155, partial [Candidatus Poseidoniaceae archaeon]|nr:hypothetical protein [Candidatus Poseidoniaceae archaeon]
MASANPRIALFIAGLMLLISQTPLMQNIFQSPYENEQVLDGLDAAFNSVEISPSSTTVTLTNNTAMAPITFNWSEVLNGSTTTIHNSSTQHKAFTFLDAAIDSNDKIHLSYFDTSTDSLIYATDKSGSWTVQVIDNGSTNNYKTGENTAIAVDSNDNIHISYTNLSSKDVMYATDSSGSWSTTAIASINSIWITWSHCQTSIAIDSNDDVHVAHHIDCGSASAKLGYTTNVGGTWATTVVGASGPDLVHGHNDIVIDSNDKV